MLPAPRNEWLHRFGADPIAVSTVQPGLRYFDTELGYVAYQRSFGVCLSLGGPICAPRDEVALAKRFLAEVPDAALFYVNDRLAREAGALTFRTALGADRVLDLTRGDTFASPSAKAAARKAARAGFSLELLCVDGGSDEDREFLKRVSASALERSVVPFEMRFLNRPMSYASSGPSHVFALALKGRRFGYAVIDPYFENGEIKGYLLNLLRFEPTSLWGVYLATVQAIAARLAAEGIGELSLGFCPLAQLDYGRTSAVMRPQLRFMEKRYAQTDYLSRLHAMKSELDGRWASRWLVTRTPQLVTPFLAFLELTGVEVWKLAREALSGSLAA
jgi:lysylphosphatidylglycerol synthetase-like protein (DUF2156 family)